MCIRDSVYPLIHISFYVSCGIAVNAYTRCRHDACLPRYVDRCVHGLSGCLTHLLTVLILAQGSNPVGFWLRLEESELASFSWLWLPVFCAYLLLSVPVSDGSLSALYSGSVPEKSWVPIRLATPLSLFGFSPLSLISQSGIFVLGLAVYSFSCASSSLVGLKKA